MNDSTIKREEDIVGKKITKRWIFLIVKYE